MTGPTKNNDNDKYNTFKERSLRLVTFYQSDEKTLTDQQKDNDKGNKDTFREHLHRSMLETCDPKEKTFVRNEVTRPDQQ